MGTDSNAISIHELLNDSCIYQMPLFQRKYQWEESNELSKFWDDLTSVVDDEVDLSFLGAIVLQIEKEGSAKSSRIYTVIDGQQRITTFFLFLCAVIDFARDHGFDATANDLEAQYLLSRLSAESGKAKIVPTFRDNSNFNEVIKNIKENNITFLPDTGKNDGPMILAYMYFGERILEFVESGPEEETEARLEKLFNSLVERMEVVQIILDKSHNANEVFDRLNTSGRPLSIIDLVRNELFQAVSENYDKARKLYSEIWEPFEKSFENSLGEHDSKSRSKIIDGFFFPYALTKLSSAKKNNLLYDLRKIWVKLDDDANESADFFAPSDAEKINPATVIDSLEEMRGPYLAMDQGIKLDGISDALWQSILALRRVPIPGVTHPYFMQLLSSVISNETEEDAALSVCKVIESFFVRRGFVGLEPTGLHSVFKKLWSEAGADSRVVAKEIETGTISFPSDDEVKRAIREKPLYKKRIEKFVLWSYEMAIQNKSFSQLSYLPKITTDHVMPQALQGDWKKVISQSDHDEILHLWGNLAPLSSPENSAKGSKSFADAKEALCNETAFLTTKRLLTSVDDWNKETIMDRTDELADWAISRWKKPAMIS